jgi:hypothetical protein
MASGVQSNQYLAAGTWTNIATGPSTSGRSQVLTIAACNLGGSSTTMSIAIATTGTSTPSAGQYIEYLAPLLANGDVFERTGIALYNGQILLAQAAAAGVSCLVYGVEGTSSGSSGLYGQLNLSASTWTQLVAAPSSGRMKSVSVNLVNTTGSACTIRLAVSTAPTGPSNTDYLEYGYTLPAYGMLERTGIVLSPSYGIGVWASAAGVNANAWGIEDIA